MLYHVSDDPNISRFDLRVGKNSDKAVVWAVHGNQLHNYFFPRDCPRVTFYAGSQTTAVDRERFLGTSKAVVAFESAWLDRVRTARLFCYQIPSDGFTCIEECAGYYQSEESVVPAGMEVIEDCLAALAAQNVEIRIVPSLWALHDRVPKSTLNFSIIRTRNAQPRNH